MASFCQSVKDRRTISLAAFKQQKSTLHKFCRICNIKHQYGVPSKSKILFANLFLPMLIAAQKIPLSNSSTSHYSLSSIWNFLPVEYTVLFWHCWVFWHINGSLLLGVCTSRTILQKNFQKLSQLTRQFAMHLLFIPSVNVGIWVLKGFLF